ncbi:MAG: XdhC family protein [Bacillota bacterium]
MIHLYRDIVSLLKEGQSFVLATIISEDGSAPRSAGGKMAILPDGSIRGTIGGGKLKGAAMERARDVFETRQPVIYPFNLSANDAAGADMICGGAGEILLDYIDSGEPDNLAVFTALVEEMEARSKSYLVCVVDKRPGAKKARQLCFVRPDGTLAGSLEGEPVLLEKLQGPYRSSASTATHSTACASLSSRSTRAARSISSAQGMSRARLRPSPTGWGSRRSYWMTAPVCQSQAFPEFRGNCARLL